MALCSFCGVDEESQTTKLLKCGKCKVSAYCSRQCQKDDWKHHKTCCRPIPDGRMSPPVAVQDGERSLARSFNQLARRPTLFDKNRNNHWHFAARPISATGSCLFVTHPATNRTYIGGPFLLSASESLEKWAACIVPYLLSIFLESTYSSEHLGERRAPWTWSTTNLELAMAAERRLREIGVKEELCHVGWSNTGEQGLEVQAAEWAIVLAESNKTTPNQALDWDSIRLSNLKSNSQASGDGETSKAFSTALEDGHSSNPKPISESTTEHFIPPVEDDID